MRLNENKTYVVAAFDKDGYYITGTFDSFRTLDGVLYRLRHLAGANSPKIDEIQITCREDDESDRYSVFGNRLVKKYSYRNNRLTLH